MGNVAVYKKGTTDFFSQGLGLLSDVVSSNLTQTVSSTGNVEQKLEVEYPIDGYLVSELVEGTILRVSVSTDKSDYGVFEIVDTLKDDSGTITVYGDPYYNRILRMSFDNGGVFTKFSSVQSSLNAAKQNITGFPADFNLISNLSTSVDLSANTYDTFGTFLEALNSAVHGNIKYSLNSIQIYSAFGKDITDITLRDDMNTSSVKITTDFSGIINKVIPVLPVLDKDGNATDQTKVGTIVTSKYSNQFLDYWAGKVIQFDTQDLANTYFDRTNADRPVQTVDVDPIGLDDDFSTINIFDTIELYSTRLDYTDKLRVSERVFDTLAENVTSFKLGSSSVNIFNQINEQNNEIFNNVVKLTNAAISANGKGIDYFGQAQPASPKEGDTWFWDDGTDFGIKQYTNGEWVDLAGSNTAEKIAAGVTDAVAQANAHTDAVKQGLSSDIDAAKSQAASLASEAASQAYVYTDKVKQGLSTDISTAASQAASQASTAEANAKSDATSQFKQAQDALAAAKTNLQNDIDENKGNIVEINQTLTGFDGTLQRVQNAVNELNQVNQLMNTEFTPDLQGWNDQTLAKTGVGTFNGSNILDLSSNSDFRQLFIPLNGSTIISASVYRKISISGGSGGRWSLMFYGSNNTFISSVYGTYQTSLPDFTLEKLESISVPSGAQSVSLRFYSDGTASIYQIAKPMLVFESKVGAYVQGNYNNNDALAKVKLTADQASLDLSTYTEDADGRIHKAQSDIEANAAEITKKVSQTDYDKKTGELSSKLNTTTDTADGTKQALSDYKEYANGNISGLSSNLTKVAGEVGLKLTKTVYDNDQSILNTSLSQWKADYDGWTGTVSKLSTKANNLGQINQLFNTEFSPDFQGWTQVSTAYYTNGNNRNGSTVVKVASDDGDYLYQDVAVSRGVVSFSSIMNLDNGFLGSFRFAINFRDSNHDYISAADTIWGPNNTSGMGYTLQKVENITVPDGARYVRINYRFRGTGAARFLQPMLVFSSTVGSYVQGNYSNNEALAQVKITAEGIDNFVRDSSGNLSSTFQNALSKTSIITGSTLASSIKTQTSSQIASALTDNNGKIISLINQDTSGVQIAGKNITLDGNTTFTALQQTVNNLGQVNQLFNTEFSPDIQGWYASPNLNSQSYPTTNTLLVKSNLSYNGSNSVMIDYSSQTADYAGYTKMYPDIVNVYGHSVVSWRMAAYVEQVSSNSATYFNATIDFFDKDMTFISNTAGSMFNKTKIGVWQNSSDNNSIFLNVAVPANAYYAGLKFYPKGQFKIHLSRSMVVFDSPTVGAYVAGAYNNNAALVQVKITADSISNFVRDSSGNISSDFQTALSKTSIITGSTLATSIQQQTATQITSALTDNNGKIISLINQDTSGVQIAGKNIVLDGNTTVTGDFYAKGGNFKNLNASNLTVGTLNGNQVNITNINASNIVTGNLTGITLMSSSNGSQFKVQGDNLQMIKKNGDNLQLSTDGLFWKDSSGNVLFEASNKITTSDIFGTAEYNVYLASLNETRSVTYATALTGSGGVSDYNYVPHRAGGVYTTWVEVNTSGGNENVYIRPLKAESEVRITASGGTDSYANLRARYVYANRIAINSRTDAQQLYLQTGDEVRVKSTNDDVDNSGYKAIRASAFNSASLAKYKQNIEVSSISGIDEINNSTIYNYQLKTSPDKQEVGLVIGDDYKISQVVVDGDGVNQYRMVSIAWKAIQELTQQVNELKQKLESKGE